MLSCLWFDVADSLLRQAKCGSNGQEGKLMTLDTPERVNNGWPGTGRVDRLVASYLALLAVAGVAVAITELVRTSASERHVIGALLLLLGSALTWALWRMYVKGPLNWWPAIFLLGYWWHGFALITGAPSAGMQIIVWVSYLAIWRAAYIRERNRKRAQPPATSEGPTPSQ
jgi:hypothetical protein